MLSLLYSKPRKARFLAAAVSFSLSATVPVFSGSSFDAAGANNRFAWKALAALQSENPNEDLVFSPYSIHLAMGMAYAGARGETAAEMEAVLGYAGEETTHSGLAALAAAVLAAVEDDRAEAGIANRVWADEHWPLEQDYIDLLAAHYGSGVERDDFTSAESRERIRNVINEWVEGETFERIPELIPDDAFTDLTRWVLVNALAFRAPFEYPFDPEMTYTRSFNVSAEETVDVRMMQQDGVYPYVQNEWVQAVALPLAGGSFSFVVLLPREGLSPAEVVAAMESGAFPLDQTVPGDGSSGTRIHLHLPRFQVKWDEELKDLFTSLGVSAAFLPGQSDLSGMAPVSDNYIHRVDHSAFLQCVEGGIEAAAATAVIGGPTSMPPVVTFDRPFVFALREDSTGAILFAGQVVRPKDPPDDAPGWRERTERALGGPLKPVGAGSWHDSPFGRIDPTRYPWVTHEVLGWGQLVGSEGRLWFWHAGGLGWMWTDLNGAYPVFHVHGRAEPWVYLDRDAPGGAALWDFVNGSYIPIE
ncbi:MAG: serpin family protein [Opitutales bacterium]|nr:serpin family protein [Opitutales bacterium]